MLIFKKVATDTKKMKTYQILTNHEAWVICKGCKTEYDARSWVTCPKCKLAPFNLTADEFFKDRI
jgi:Zn finger protein HypA/HybF involved in hydrogenase expression